MSIWLNVAAVPGTVFDRLSADSSLVKGLFFESSTPSSLGGVDVSGCDYRLLAEAQEAMADVTGCEEEPDFAPTGDLAFDAGLGPAFFVAPKDKMVLRNDSWGIAAALDTEVDGLLKRARKQGLYVVAVMS